MRAVDQHTEPGALVQHVATCQWGIVSRIAVIAGRVVAVWVWFEWATDRDIPPDRMDLPDLSSTPLPVPPRYLTEAVTLP